MRHVTFAILFTVALGALLAAFFSIQGSSQPSNVVTVLEKIHHPAGKVRIDIDEHVPAPEQWALFVDDGRTKFFITCSQSIWQLVSVGDLVELKTVVDDRGRDVRKLAIDDWNNDHHFK